MVGVVDGGSEDGWYGVSQSAAFWSLSKDRTFGKLVKGQYPDTSLTKRAVFFLEKFRFRPQQRRD